MVVSQKVPPAPSADPPSQPRGGEPAFGPVDPDRGTDRADTGPRRQGSAEHPPTGAGSQAHVFWEGARAQSEAIRKEHSFCCPDPRCPGSERAPKGAASSSTGTWASAVGFSTLLGDPCR